MNYIASKRKTAWLKLLYHLHLIKGHFSVDSGIALITVKYFGIYYLINEKNLAVLYAELQQTPTQKASPSIDEQLSYYLHRNIL